MRRLWVVRCFGCNKGVTVGSAPGLPGFIRTINCSFCNKKIDAKFGFYVLRPISYHKESFDLLSVN